MNLKNQNKNFEKTTPKTKRPFRCDQNLLRDQNFWHRFAEASKDSFWEYIENTKVSGMWLLRPNRTHGLSRWIWSAVLIHLLSLAVYLALQLWLKFYSYPIVNTISKSLPITDVPFPGITVCSSRVVNKKLLWDFIQKLDIPKNFNITEIEKGLEQINAFTDENLYGSEQERRAADNILSYNNISIYQAALEVSTGCDHFVRRCFWGNDEFPCRQKGNEIISFIPTTSYLGPCCSFNYNPRNASYVPFSANIYGMNGGLSFIGQQGSDENLSNGLIVLIHHPMDFVAETASLVRITANSENFVEIVPTVKSSSNQVLELVKTKRDCMISEDLGVGNYRQAACILNCQSEEIQKRCKCHPYHYPNAKSNDMVNECKLEDIECFQKNLDVFMSIKCPQCLPNCYDVTYSTSTYKTDLLSHNYSISPFYSPINETKNTFIVRFYLSKQTVPAIRKVTSMSWMSLLSDLGGVFNLSLGLSVISVVEFFYFGFYRVYVNYKARTVLLAAQYIN